VKEEQVLMVPRKFPRRRAAHVSRLCAGRPCSPAAGRRGVRRESPTARRRLRLRPPSACASRARRRDDVLLLAAGFSSFQAAGLSAMPLARDFDRPPTWTLTMSPDFHDRTRVPSRTSSTSPKYAPVPSWCTPDVDKGAEGRPTLVTVAFQDHAALRSLISSTPLP